MGAVVAAAMAAAERRLVHRLREAGALSADTAVELELRRGMDGRRLQRLERHGVIHRLPDGRCWLDETACAAWQETRRLRMTLVAVVVALALGVTAFYLWSIRP